MAWKEGTVQPQHFVEEIDYNEIEKLEVCKYHSKFQAACLETFSRLLHNSE
jgi:hypothetical protein